MSLMPHVIFWFVFLVWVVCGVFCFGVLLLFVWFCFFFCYIFSKGVSQQLLLRCQSNEFRASMNSVNFMRSPSIVAKDQDRDVVSSFLNVSQGEV